MLTHNLPGTIAIDYSVMLPDGREVSVQTALTMLREMLENEQGTAGQVVPEPSGREAEAE